MRLHPRSTLYGASIAILSVFGCASIVNYHYYGLQLPAECYEQGELLGKVGHSGWPDLPLAQCEPDAGTQGKCVIELSADHFAKEAALLQCQSDLKDCEKGLRL